MNNTEVAKASGDQPAPERSSRSGRKVRALRAPHAGKVACRSVLPAMRTQGIGTAREKCRTIHSALDATGARVVTIVAIASRERLQAQPL